MRHLTLARAALFGLLVLPSPATAAFIVNIDATKYGFSYPTGGSDPAPVPGQVIVPIYPAAGPDQLTLAAGTYTITNATGLAGADPNFTAWRYNGGANWVWAFVLADAVTNRVIFYGDANAYRNSQAAVAAQPAVQNYSATFTLAAATRVNFMVRDYGLYDNAGGVSLAIEPSGVSAVPAPGGLVLMASAVPLLAAWRMRRGKVV